MKSGGTNQLAAATNAPDKKSKEATKPINVVFVVEGDHVKMVPVKLGISDDNYWETTDGLNEGQEIVSGNSRAVNRDLEDDRKIRKGGAGMDNPKDGARK
jgi:multidrug efflux pump subunit AcrA (membrane-fusion protein)